MSKHYIVYPWIKPSTPPHPLLKRNVNKRFGWTLFLSSFHRDSQPSFFPRFCLFWCALMKTLPSTALGEQTIPRWTLTQLAPAVPSEQQRACWSTPHSPPAGQKTGMETKSKVPLRPNREFSHAIPMYTSFVLYTKLCKFGIALFWSLKSRDLNHVDILHSILSHETVNWVVMMPHDTNSDSL